MIRVFNSDDTWRKLGYLFHGDSREFRRILDKNPQWEIGYLPAEGDIIEIDSQEIGTSLGKINSLSLTDFAGLEDSANDNFYPWTNIDDYYGRLSQYTEFSLQNVEDLN